jgi:PqqD family protein of HPr-rel-A system
VPRVKPRARAELAVAELEGESVVYDPVARKLHYLNHSAALIFGLCDGRTTISEMAQAIGEAYEIDPRELDNQIRTLLAQLREFGLVEGKTAEAIHKQAEEQRLTLEQFQRIPVPQDT